MYNDIIDLERPKSSHKKMSIQDRASQFSSFQALTGYSDMIGESQRITDIKKELSEDEIVVINNKLSFLLENISLKPLVKITYFIKDNKKDGGKYQDIEGIVKKIDFYKRVINVNGIIIPFENIFFIDSEIFKKNN